jgi:uncharacterized protein YjdB
MQTDILAYKGIIKGVTEGRVKVKVSTPTQTGIESQYHYIDISGSLVSGITAITASPSSSSDTLHYVNIQSDDPSNCTVQFSSATIPSNATNNQIIWSITEGGAPVSADVATISSTGLFTAKQAGRSIVVRATAADNTLATYTRLYSKTISTIRPVLAITDISSNTGLFKVTAAAPTITLTPIVNPAEASVKEYTWTSSDPTVASVNSSGVVTKTTTGGTTTIKAVYKLNPDVSGSCVVTHYVPLDGIVVTSNKGSFTIGANVTDAKLTATVTPLTATVKTVTWTTDNSGVCLIDASGNLTPVAGGVANITATTTDPDSKDSNGNLIKKTVAITVAIPVTSITDISSTGNRSTFTIDPIQLSSEVVPSNASNKTITWTSGTTTVAKVDASGVVVPSGVAGTSIITAKSEDGEFVKTYSIDVSYSTNYGGV